MRRINAETMRGDRKRRVRTVNGSRERCIANITFYFANHLISFTTASISHVSLGTFVYIQFTRATTSVITERAVKDLG